MKTWFQKSKPADGDQDEDLGEETGLRDSDQGEDIMDEDSVVYSGDDYDREDPFM